MLLIVNEAKTRGNSPNYIYIHIRAKERDWEMVNDSVIEWCGQREEVREEISIKFEDLK